MCGLQWNTRSFGISACLMDLYEFHEKCLHQIDVICTQKAPGTTAPQSCAEQIEIHVSFTKLNGCTADKERQSAEFRDACKDCRNTSSLLAILGKVYCVLGKIDIPPGVPFPGLAGTGQQQWWTPWFSLQSYRGGFTPFLLAFNVLDKLREKKPGMGSLGL